MGILETVFAVGAVVIAILLFILKMMWNVLQSKNKQIDDATGAAEEWRNYGETQRNNAEIDKETFEREGRVNGETDTDKIITDDRNSGNWSPS
jgi:hypothetical protein